MTAQDAKPVVLVTGSSGLIGTGVMNALAGSYRVVGLDVVEPDDMPKSADFIPCDLTDDKKVKEALDRVREAHGGRIASVIHLAAYYDFSGADSPLYEKLTVGGTKRLITHLQEFDVEQFVFTSTLLVMKPVEDDTATNRLTEESPTRAEWPYPESKLQTERVLEENHGDIPVVVLRLAGAYDEDCHSIPIGQQIKRIYEKDMESYLFPGDPDHGQAFIHLEDVVSCIQKTIEHRHELEDYEVFLIGEPDVMSYEDLQDRIGELLHGKEWPTIRIPKPVAKVGALAKEKLLQQEMFIKPWMVDLADDHYPVQITRAQTVLEWSPTQRLRDVLPEIIRRLKADPEAWLEENGLAEDESEAKEEKARSGASRS